MKKNICVYTLVFILMILGSCKKDTAPAIITNTYTPSVDTTSASPTKWWNDAVFYEVFVRSFYDANGDGKGDLKGLTQKLDYLNDGNPATNTDLGITAIWLMPIMQSPSYHGYDVTDYRTVESDYGTNDDFKTFIAAAHQRGIKVIIDYVMNHTSNEHPWFTQSASSTTSPYRNWYRWSATNPGDLGFSNNPVWYLYNGSYYYGLFWSGMPDLNYAEPAVKTEMFDIANFWLKDMHVDGFRLDAARYIFETPGVQADAPQTLQFWHDFRTSFKAVNGNAMAVGEAWTTTSQVVPYVQNDRLDFCFEFDLASTLVYAVNNNDVVDLRNQINEVVASYPKLQYGTFLTNHDQDRVMSDLGSDVTKAKLACQLLLTLPGVPYIYYGEEIGTVGSGADENKRTPLQWSNAANGGFTTGYPWESLQSDYSTKNIAAQQIDNNSLWSTYHQMIQLRNNQVALRRGDYTDIGSNQSSSLIFLRTYQSESIIVAANLDSNPITNITISLSSSTLSAGNYQLTDLVSGTIQTITVDSNGGFSSQNIGGLTGRNTAVYKLHKL